MLNSAVMLTSAESVLSFSLCIINSRQIGNHVQFVLKPFLMVSDVNLGATRDLIVLPTCPQGSQVRSHHPALSCCMLFYHLASCRPAAVHRLPWSFCGTSALEMAHACISQTAAMCNLNPGYVTNHCLVSSVSVCMQAPYQLVGAASMHSLDLRPSHCMMCH